MKVEFDAKKHEYIVNSVVVPSVTTIIRKVFGYKYGTVRADILERAAAKGTAVHEEIAEYLNNGTYGFSEEFDAVKAELETMKETPLLVEEILYAETKYGAFCGTADTFFSNGLLIDYKTSRNLDKESVTRQLNMYAYQLIKAGYIVKNLEAWHLVGSKLRRVEVPLYPLEFTENIMRYYKSGKKAENDNELLGAEDVKDDKLENACNEIKKIDRQIEELQAKRDAIVNNLKDYFSLKNISDYTRGDMSLVYIPASVRKSFDSARFKREMGETEYCKWMKESETKAQLRVKYKGE